MMLNFFTKKKICYFPVIFESLNHKLLTLQEAPVYTLLSKDHPAETSAQESSLGVTQEESFAGLLSDGSLSSVDSSLAATPTGPSPFMSPSTTSNPLLLAVDMIEVDMFDD